MEKMLLSLKASASPNSYRQYYSVLKSLGVLSGNLNPLKFNDVKEVIEKKPNLNTQKTMYATLITLLKHHPSPEKTPIDDYRAIMNELINEVNKQKENGEYNDKQKNSLLKMADIIEKRDSYLDGMKEFNTTPSNWDKLVNHLILSLYTSGIPPRRNEYYLMRIISNKKKINPRENFLLWNKNDKKFIYNVYKTSKTYGRQEIDITDPKLIETIKHYLKHRKILVDNPENDFFLVRFNGDKLKNSNDITRRLNSIIGRRIGASMLRHIYLTEKYGQIKNEMEQDAEEMGHSVATQQKEYVKNKTTMI